MSNSLSMNQSAILSQNAFEIKRLGKRATEDIIKMGELLTECKKILGHGNFTPWIKKEFDWEERTAQNFIRVFEMSKSANFADLNLPVSSLYLLAAPSTPESVRTEVLAKAEAGEKITHSKVKKTVADAKPKKDNGPSKTKPVPDTKSTSVDDEMERLKTQIHALQAHNKKLQAEVAELKDKNEELNANLKSYRALRKKMGSKWDDFSVDPLKFMNTEVD